LLDLWELFGVASLDKTTFQIVWCIYDQEENPIYSYKFWVSLYSTQPTQCWG